MVFDGFILFHWRTMFSTYLTFDLDQTTLLEIRKKYLTERRKFVFQSSIAHENSCVGLEYL